MQFSDYAQALGAAQRLVPSYADQQHDAAVTQGQLLQNRQTEQQIAGVDAQQQEHAAFQSAFVDLGDKPSAEKIRMLGVRFPSLSKGLNDAVEGMEKGQRAQVVSETAQMYSALSANKPDLAKSLIQRHIDADKAAGNEPDPEDAALISMIDSGDKQQISAAKGMLYATLAAADPDSAAKTIGEYGSGATGKTHVITQGGALVDDTGKELYRSAPAEANALEVPVYDDQGKRIGTRLIENGGKGGGQSSGGSGAAVGSGSPAAGRTQYGWTPRARNGGDNTDAAVDGKIAGMTKALGLSPTDPFPASMTNREVYEALTLSEGGRGSIADRNNNRGNLKDPKTLAYRQFTNKDAGDAAAIAQVARNRARGQNTIQTMVEGLPVGGTRAASGGDSSYIGPVATPQGRAAGYIPGTAVGGMSAAAIDGAAARYNMTGKLPTGLGRKGDVQQAVLSRAAQLAGGQDAGNMIADQAGRAADLAALSHLQKSSANISAFERTALRNGALAVRLSAANGNGNIPIFNAWLNAGRSATGDGTVASFHAAVDTFANEYAKIASSVSGAGVTSDSARAHAHEVINTAQSPEQFLGVMRTLTTDMHNRTKGLETQRQVLLQRISGHPQQPAKPAKAPPAVGSVVRGFRFNGGNPADPNSWSRAK